MLIPENQPQKYNTELKLSLSKIAQTIRHLTMDAVERTGSGHPGLPLGCAEIGAYLYGFYLQQNPENPHWLNRDRFVLSAGHGSLLQYTCMHLAGYPLTLDDLKNYRCGGSKTPSHPQSMVTEGVETTTGADGHGVGNGIGMALGLKILQNKFFDDEFPLITSKVIVLAGDGCIMEGIGAESCSLAAHLSLNNLIVVYDSNATSLDGYVKEINSENTALRYKAYGWDVVEIDGHDFDQIHAAFQDTRFNQKKPLLIIAHTIIGRGAPHKQGTPEAHGVPLGQQEVQIAKKQSGLPDKEFYVSPDIYDFFKEKREHQKTLENKWNHLFTDWEQAYPQAKEALMKMQAIPSVKDLETLFANINISDPLPTRFASREVTNCVVNDLPQLYGGSADLAKSDGTFLFEHPVILPPCYQGRNIKFGVREFAMGSMAIGLSQTGYIVPFIGTFLVFSDYMRHSIRTASLMRNKIIFQLTHDSIFVAEDGPTHQPVEHIASLRAIPHLQVIRPADQNETKHAWIAALHWEGPTALILSRQSLPELKQTQVPYDQGLGRGAYIIRKEQSSKCDYALFATGSEVHLALEVADALEGKGYRVRVISMPSWEIFEGQPKAYQDSLLEGELGVRISIEAGTKQGWERYIGRKGISISVEDFGCSGSISYMAEKFGFTVSSILLKLGIS